MTKIVSVRGLAASAPTPAAVRPPRAFSPGSARSPASMAQGRQAHPRIERVAGRAAERAARSACDVGAALPSFAPAPWANADGATANRAPGASWSNRAPFVPPGRTAALPLICVISSATAPRAMASAAGCIRRRRTGPTAMPSSIVARTIATSSASSSRLRTVWAAVNHFNTGHPHVHVIINGRDQLGEDLVINGDYIAHGIRERASELVTLELGPVTAIEQQRKLATEIDQDRFTRIDRALIAEAGEGLMDLRHAPADPRGISDRALRLARLGKLEE